MKKKLISVLISLVLLGQSVMASEQQSIVGGYDGAIGASAALVLPDESVLPLSPGFTGQINSVAMNDVLFSIIGGQDTVGSIPYAAFVSPTGQVSPISSLPANGTINSVSINHFGNAIIAGVDSGAGLTYAAFVSSSGAVQSLPGAALPGAVLYSAAINDSGNALIGGEDGMRYVATVSSSGVVTRVDSGPGLIFSVAINSTGQGIVGGGHKTPAGLFAALVSPSGVVTDLGLPFGLGMPGPIWSVAINETNHAIIGGEFIGVPYVALVSPAGTVSPLSSSALPAVGSIRGVAINNSSSAIIGGYDTGGSIFAALVSSDGIVQPLTFPFVNGGINSVAINDAQVAIIGGVNDDSGNAFAALVSPTGIVTPLDLGLVGGQILSVATALATPTSVGPYGSLFYSTLAASFSLQAHIDMFHKQFWPSKKNKKEVSMLENVEESALMVNAGSKMGCRNQQSAKKASEPYTIQSSDSYVVWASFFNDFFNLSKQGSIPAFTDEVAGAIVALDYKAANDFVFGGGFAYAFNYIKYSESLGHAKVHEELAFLFSSFPTEYVFVNATIWGGGYQLKNERHSVSPITSIGKTDGWILNPHFEVSTVAYRNAADWFLIEPFAMVDWVNFWQDGFTEHGSSGFNLVVPHQYSSLLRSEVGLRFYENLIYEWGRVLMDVKGSYINQAPFHVGSIAAAFVGAVSSFSVAVNSSRIQNLGGVEFNCAFIPKEDCYPYGSISLQGEFGSSLQSYFTALEIGRRF